MDELDMFRSFSHPYQPQAAGFAELISDAYHKQAIRDRIPQLRSELSSSSFGLIEFLEDWTVTPPATSDVSWSPSFSVLARPPATSVHSVSLDAAIQSAIELLVRGNSGCWHANRVDPSPLRIGTWLLPAAHRVTASLVNQDAIEIILVKDEARVCEIRSGVSRSDVSVKGAQKLVSIDYGKIVLLDQRTAYCGTLGPEISELTPAITPDVASAIDRSLELVGRASPEYLSWIRRVIRAVAVVKYQEGRLRSGSSPDLPGLVYFSGVPDERVTAEMLVHESAHQYMHLLTRLGPLDDGTDTNRYYSPIKKTDRTIDKVALAYHAFANIGLFYNSCRRILDDAYYDAAIGRLIPALREMQSILLSSRALTEVGRAMIEPLLSETEKHLGVS